MIPQRQERLPEPRRRRPAEVLAALSPDPSGDRL